MRSSEPGGVREATSRASPRMRQSAPAASPAPVAAPAATPKSKRSTGAAYMQECVWDEVLRVVPARRRRGECAGGRGGAATPGGGGADRLPARQERDGRVRART